MGIKNYLTKKYYEGKISLDLFELLYEGMLVYDLRTRFDAEKVYHSEWFADIRGNKERNKREILKIGSLDMLYIYLLCNFLFLQMFTNTFYYFYFMLYIFYISLMTFDLSLILYFYNHLCFHHVCCHFDS